MLKKYLMIFLVSMVPIVELRGAIPISQGFQLPLLQSYIICVIGNMLPVPIIYLFARRVLEWGKDKKYIGKFFTFCIEKGHKGGQKLKEKAGNGLFAGPRFFPKKLQKGHEIIDFMAFSGGDEEDRTLDLTDANASLYIFCVVFNRL